MHALDRPTARPTDWTTEQSNEPAKRSCISERLMLCWGIVYVSAKTHTHTVKRLNVAQSTEYMRSRWASWTIHSQQDIPVAACHSTWLLISREPLERKKNSGCCSHTRRTDMHISSVYLESDTLSLLHSIRLYSAYHRHKHTHRRRHSGTALHTQTDTVMCRNLIFTKSANTSKTEMKRSVFIAAVYFDHDCCCNDCRNTPFHFEIHRILKWLIVWFSSAQLPGFCEQFFFSLLVSIRLKVFFDSNCAWDKRKGSFRFRCLFFLISPGHSSRRNRNYKVK